MTQQPGPDDSEWPVYRPPGEGDGPQDPLRPAPHPGQSSDPRQRPYADPSPGDSYQPTGYGQNLHGQNPHGQNPYGENTYGENKYASDSSGSNLFAQEPRDKKAGRRGSQYVPYVAFALIAMMMFSGNSRFIFVIIVALGIWMLVKRRLK